MMSSSSDELLRDGAEPAVTIEDLRVIRGKSPAVQDISVRIARGTITGLLGPSGSGKTTLMRCIVGTQIVAGGAVTVLGHPAGSATLRRRVGYMPQDATIYNDLKVIDNIRYFASLYGVDGHAAEQAVEAVDLQDQRSAYCANLSGGQRARVSLACALVGRPELVFLDEPTAGMDAHARRLVWELIDALRRDGVTVVLTTHQLKEAEELADRLVIIDHGATVAAGTPTELMRTGAKDQLRFTAPPRLDLSLLASALPEDYKASEVTPGEYLVEGPVDPQVLATVTAWCAQIDVLATDMRVEQRSLEDVFLDLTGRKLRQ